MPLRRTDYGYVCPLGRWRQYNFEGRDPVFDQGPTPADIGDPQSECIRCSFSKLAADTLNAEGQDWDWNKVCQAPSDMGLSELQRLRARYDQTPEAQRGQNQYFGIGYQKIEEQMKGVVFLKINNSFLRSITPYTPFT